VKLLRKDLRLIQEAIKIGREYSIFFKMDILQL
jgi:hypothetical protein